MASTLWSAIATLLRPTFGPFGLDLYLEKNEKEALLTSHAEVILARLAVDNIQFNYILKVIKRSCLNLTSAVLLITALAKTPQSKLREFYSGSWDYVKAQVANSVDSK